jgi:hypothetical protein
MNNSLWGSAAMAFFVALCAVMAIGFVILIWGTIFRKAGYSRWLCLLMLIPLLNVILLIWFVVSKWPLETEVERLRAAQGTAIQT